MAVDIATDTMGAFFPAAETTAEKMEALQRVVNVMGLATTSANMNLETMFETVKDVAPSMRMAGQEIEQFSTLTAFMADAGLKGTKSATALKNMITRLANPVPKMRKELRRLNIQIEDENGNFLKLSKILDQVRAKTAKMGTRQRAATTSILFGNRAIAGASTLFANADKKIEDFEKRLRSTGRTTKDIAEDMRKSLGNRLAALKSSAIELGFKIIEEFTDPADKGIQGLTKSIRELDVKPIVADIKSIASDMGDAFRFLRDNKEQIKEFIKFLIVFKGATMGAKGAAFVFSDVLLASAGAVATVKVAVFGLLAAIGVILVDLKAAGVTWEHIWVTIELTAVRAMNGMRTAFQETINFFIRGINGIMKAQHRLKTAVPRALGLPTEAAPESIPEVFTPGLIEGKRKAFKLLTRQKDLEKARIASERKKLGLRGAVDVPGAATSGAIASQSQFAAGAEKSILGKGLSQDIGAQVAASLYGSNPQAPKQKVEGTIRFENPPPGMSFEGNVNGQPITSNVGAQ
jgi:hypothetical protein